VTVEFWSGWTGREAKVFQALVDRFNREHPDLFVNNFGGVQQDSKTVRAITAGVPPDAFFIWDSTTLGPLAENGALQPLDDRLASAGLTEQDFVPVSLDLCRYRGRLYALPVLIDATALYWDRRAFRAAGLDPDRPPVSPEELTEYARRLTQRDGAGRLARIGFQPTDDLLPFLYATGAPLIDAAGRPAADTPETRRALAWYGAVIQAMGGAEEVNAFAAGFGQSQSSNHPFFRGQTAMLVSGEWFPYWIERYAPGLDYGVAPFPRADPDAPPAAVIGGNPVCLPRESRHPEAAWRFISWLQRREVQREFALNIYNLPNRRDLLADPALTRGSRAARAYSVLLDLSAGPGARAFPSVPYASFYQAELTNARDFVAHGDKSVEQAAQDLQRRVERQASALGAREARAWEGEAPAEPRSRGPIRLGRSLALPFHPSRSPTP
jgi:multiple sugar transport system substrate-binding protein